ncbi:hypothetical protein NA57DRAFT_81879 [Rhizodiscina lignyota]|uniref:Uncharacterized protein n=1 Tax=Rhizodiscina lignyota TaxID=1504668 RepID=A0A9P4I0X9_9PEZI|nr:hypothetical protein NA57DRAFT_81879 [Rhizodiscina lignyota]
MDMTDADSTRPHSPSLPPRYSRRLEDELIDHLAEQQSPRYSRLFADDFIPPHLVPPTIPEDATGSTADLTELLRGPSSARSVPNLRRPNLISPRIHLQPQLPPGPLSLTIDSGAIYPPPPSKALYHLPRSLTWNGNEIYLNLSIPAVSPPSSSSGRRRPAKESPRDLNLYVLRRTPFTNEIALLPKRDVGRAAVMKGKRSLFSSGTTWDVEVHGKVVLHYSKGRWRDVKGKAVAAETRREGKKNKKRSAESTFAPSQKPEMTIFRGGVGGLSEETTRHLIVAAWCARLWHTRHKEAPLIGALAMGRAYLNHGFDRR